MFISSITPVVQILEFFMIFKLLIKTDYFVHCSAMSENLYMDTFNETYLT